MNDYQNIFVIIYTHAYPLIHSLQINYQELCPHYPHLECVLSTFLKRYKSLIS